MDPSRPVVSRSSGRTTATLLDPVTPKTQKATAASVLSSFHDGRGCVVHRQKRWKGVVSLAPEACRWPARSSGAAPCRKASSDMRIRGARGHLVLATACFTTAAPWVTLPRCCRVVSG